MKRLAITGSSGYLGRQLVEHLRRHRPAVEILGIDVRSPATVLPERFVDLDILDSRLGELLRGFRPDAVVHAAFVLAPMRDGSRMRRINVDGCRNVLAAAAACGAGRIMLMSSATAYGAWPENPVPIEETQPLRPARFQYAADKVEIEVLAEAFAAAHPAIAVSRLRPAIIAGQGMDNYLSRFIFDMPELALLDGCDTPLQFVHEEDMVAAILAILDAGARGAFNVGPPDWCRISEVAGETARRARRLPYWLARVLHGAAWTFRLPGHETPPEFLQFARYPWVVRAARLETELGFRFRHTSLETLRETARFRLRERAGGAI